LAKQRGRPRLDRARQDTDVLSVDDLVKEARPYLTGWVKTLGEAGRAVETEAGIVPGNVSAAVAGLNILQGYLAERQRTRAGKILDKAAKARDRAVKEMRGRPASPP